jgi:hypothetical protein
MLLGDLTFMGTCFISIFKYISNKIGSDFFEAVKINSYAINDNVVNNQEIAFCFSTKLCVFLQLLVASLTACPITDFHSILYRCISSGILFAS